MSENEIAFYAASAQMLPTLVIGLALGLRELRANRNLLLTIVAAEMCLALIGAWQATAVLIKGEATGAQELLVKFSIGAISLGLVGLIWRWFTHPDDWHAGRFWRFDESQSGPPPEDASPPPSSSTPSRRLDRLISAAALAAVAVGAYLVGRRRE